VKANEIVKPSKLDDFIRLQISCLDESIERSYFLARIDHRQNHLPGNPVIELIVAYEIAQTPASHISFLVTDQIDSVLRLFEQSVMGKAMAAELGIAWIELDKGLQLQPVCIPKPWGQEIWYTGIESRGVSRVKSSEGFSPLDWVIAAAPEQLLGKDKTLTLLKILDPLPDEVYGDLYFEMHEVKQEVYVVTHVDPQAWPTGVGGIRFGFNQALRKKFNSDVEFKRAYLSAVHEYRQVRQEIDATLDQQRRDESIHLNEPVMPEKMKNWQRIIPDILITREKQLREAMENFIAIKNIRLGDVITVPCFTPHSLQHGVRTVEFQTPVYERKILSFAQKVLTQSHWDTNEAIEIMDLEAPHEPPLDILQKTDNVYREQIVRFDDFKVERMRLTFDTQITFPEGSYRLLLVVSGLLEIEDSTLCVEQAMLIPASVDLKIRCLSPSAILLIAEPV